MFKIGDTVYDPRFEGAGKVVEVSHRAYSDYPITAEWEDGNTDCYTSEGCYGSASERPILSHTPWTERAVTRRAWTPEKDEIVLLKSLTYGWTIARYTGETHPPLLNGGMTYILGRGKGHDPIHRELKHIRPLSDAEELLGSQVEEEKAEQPEQRPFKVGDRVEFHGTRADNAASSCGGIRVGRITQVFPSLGRIKFKIDGDKFEWAAASDGVVNGSYENLHIRHAPRTQRPFGPEDVAEPFGWDSEGNPVICIEHDAIDKTLFVVSSSFSHEGWITLDGNKHTNIGYPHCPITRTKPAK